MDMGQVMFTLNDATLQHDSVELGIIPTANGCAP
jgi:hypothetical protein